MTAARARHGVALVTLLSIPSLLAGPAHAYVRATTTSGVPVWWRSPSVTMAIYLGAPPPNMTADEYWNASQLAAQAWSHSDIACTSLTISMSRNEAATADAVFDRKNVLVFRQDNWCQQADPTDPSPPPCYPANAMAVTTLVKNKTTGEIVDADMEINAVNFAWADLVANPAEAKGRTADFQNTLTHELGHVVGLAHNCYLPNDGPTPLTDNTGNPEIDCRDSNVPASVTDATMYPVVATSDTERRTLSPDDAQAVCDIYPGQTAFLGGSGCAVVGPASVGLDRGWAIGLACFLSLALAVTAYRRSRPRA
jgi:hypothetical protein